MDQESKEFVQKLAPSMGSGAVEKSLDGDTVAGLTRSSNTKVAIGSEQKECVFKRGGRCVNHGMMGEKIVETSKVWDKKKNGMFGWKTRMKTKYVCRYEGVVTSNVSETSVKDCQEEGVAKSNSMSGGEGMESTRMRNTALGGPTTEVLSEFVNTTRISGAGVLEAGSYSSEMKRISGVEKDLR